MNTDSTDWLEARRFRAWELKQEGWSQRKIAEALGVSEGAVSQWMEAARDGGPDSLKRKQRLGPAPKLSAEQLARLPHVLEQVAESFGFRGQVWTRARVATVIRREFGVSLGLRHTGRICAAASFANKSRPPIVGAHSVDCRQTRLLSDIEVTRSASVAKAGLGSLAASL